MKIELTEQQVNALIQIIDNTSVLGKDIEFIAELKKALAKTEGK